MISDGTQTLAHAELRAWLETVQGAESICGTRVEFEGHRFRTVRTQRTHADLRANVWDGAWSREFMWSSMPAWT